MRERVTGLLESPRVTSRITGALVSVLAVAAVTASISLVSAWVPVLSLGVLYIFAVLPVAVVWGLALSLPVAVGSMLAFNYFFLPPVHTLTMTDGANWLALGVYSATAVVVSDLAARSRRRTLEAEQRGREAALLADISTGLMQRDGVQEQLHEIEQRCAEVLGSGSLRINLGPPSGERPGAVLLETAGRVVGRIELPEGGAAPAAAGRRFLPALASLLAVAVDRERLAGQAFEAEALRRSDALKTALLRAVSHDLRSPLTAIVTSVSALRNEHLQLGPRDRYDLLETIAVESRRLERLVENLLDLSRLQAGAAEPAQELWSVDLLIAEALDQVAQSHRIETSIPDDVPVVLVDGVQVERALVNLLENAVRFSPGTSEISVRVTATSREVVIRVVDQGPGLPEQELERVFAPFHRANPAVRGAGLGLAIARGFVEANAGRAWAESVGGQGASFAIAFPLARAVTEASV